MYRELGRWMLLIVLLVASVVTLVPVSQVDAAAPYYYRHTAVSGVDCVAADTVSMTVFGIEYVAPAAGQIDLYVRNYFDGVLVADAWSVVTSAGSYTGPGSFAHTAIYPVTIELRYDTYVDGDLLYRSSLFVTCPGIGPASEAYIVNTDFTLVEEVEPAAVPGCDVLIDLPSTAVVGAFVSDAPLYYAPGLLVSPQTTLEAGKTAWVLGVDASGAYYKLLWGCTFVWVPVESIGPNYDDVWAGTPLPTGVVN